ncbi:MAG: heavy-metal-associated domain-containing protein [Anaerolineae bacterium]
MTTITLSLPTMYADHHVLSVRKVLASLDGISQVVASSGRKQVTLAYEESVISPERITEALSKAGYVPDREPVFPSTVERSKDGSSWHTILPRVTVTTTRD